MSPSWGGGPGDFSLCLLFYSSFSLPLLPSYWPVSSCHWPSPQASASSLGRAPSWPAYGMRIAALHDSQLCLVKSNELSVSKVIAHCSENTATSQSGRRRSLFSVRIPCSGVLGQMMQKMLTPLCACSFSVSLSVNLGKVSVAAGKEWESELVPSRCS